MAGSLGEVVDTLKTLEHAGYHFEAADASLELLMRGAGGWEQPYFRTRVVLGRHGPPFRHWRSSSGTRSRSTLRLRPSVKLWVDGERRLVAVGEGNGPVNALDAALRAALNGRYPNARSQSR